MILDDTLNYAKGLAYNGTVSEVDLQNADPARGTKICVYYNGTGMTAAGDMTISFQTASSSGGSFDTQLSLTLSPAEFNAGGIFSIPTGNDVKRYSKLVLGGSPSAGTWNAGIIFDGQTNT